MRVFLVDVRRGVWHARRPCEIPLIRYLSGSATRNPSPFGSRGLWLSSNLYHYNLCLCIHPQETCDAPCGISMMITHLGKSLGRGILIGRRFLQDLKQGLYPLRHGILFFPLINTQQIPKHAGKNQSGRTLFQKLRRIV